MMTLRVFRPTFLREKMGLIGAAFGAALMLMGCAQNLGPGAYSRADVGSVSSTATGTVISARNVNISGTRTHVGTGAGVLIGGVAGSTIGNGNAENAVGAIAGAVLGGLAGAAMEEGFTRKTGIEYTIQGDDGQVFTIVQGGGGTLVPPGGRVRIIYGADRARVVPDYGGGAPTNAGYQPGYQQGYEGGY